MSVSRNEIVRQLVEKITRSRHFDQRTSTYNPPARRIPRAIRKLLRKLDQVQGDESTKQEARIGDKSNLDQ